MEVIYTGLRQTPEQIVSAALQEDADAIGLSILSGAPMHICPRVRELLREKGLNDVLVVVGGIIPDVDIPKLNAIGITGIFIPGTPMQQIIDFINNNARARVWAGVRSRSRHYGKLAPLHAHPAPRRRQPHRATSDFADVRAGGDPGVDRQR